MQTLYLHRFETPLGLMVGLATEAGVCLAEFAGQDAGCAGIEEVRALLGAELEIAAHPNLLALERQLGEYFEGKRQQFEVPLHLVGTPFQESVWQALLDIPYGQTRSYRDQALSLGNLLAIRAVARANGANRIAVVVPCHRVIGSGGSLTGYAGGLWRKQRLLMLEKQHSAEDLPLFRMR